VNPIRRPASLRSATWGIRGRNRTTLPLTTKSPIAGAPGSVSSVVVVVVKMRMESVVIVLASTGAVKVSSRGALMATPPKLAEKLNAATAKGSSPCFAPWQEPKAATIATSPARTKRNPLMSVSSGGGPPAVLGLFLPWLCLAKRCPTRT
jgi:hypothetical protein